MNRVRAFSHLSESSKTEIKANFFSKEIICIVVIHGNLLNQLEFVALTPNLLCLSCAQPQTGAVSFCSCLQDVMLVRTVNYQAYASISTSQTLLQE